VADINVRVMLGVFSVVLCKDLRYQKEYLHNPELKGAGRAMQLCVTSGMRCVPRSVCTCTYRCDVGDFWLTKKEENM